MPDRTVLAVDLGGIRQGDGRAHRRRQLTTLSEVANLGQARQAVVHATELKRYEPRNMSVWDEAYGRYRALRPMGEHA